MKRTDRIVSYTVREAAKIMADLLESIALEQGYKMKYKSLVTLEFEKELNLRYTKGKHILVYRPKYDMLETDLERLNYMMSTTSYWFGVEMEEET
jgi:hypothetical protein